MKLFADTADTDEIRKLADAGIIDGVTTNPSLVAKTGLPFDKCVSEICDVVDGPVSLEVFSTKAKAMVFGVSGLCFVLLFGLLWGWQEVAILTGVMIFHELGHFTGMALTGYRNTQLVFLRDDESNKGSFD